METITLQNNELYELSDLEMRDYNGGYGYHSSNAPGAEAVGKAFWSSVNSFIDGFIDGYNDARKPQH